MGIQTGKPNLAPGRDELSVFEHSQPTNNGMGRQPALVFLYGVEILESPTSPSGQVRTLSRQHSHTLSHLRPYKLQGLVVPAISLLLSSHKPQGLTAFVVSPPVSSHKPQGLTVLVASPPSSILRADDPHNLSHLTTSKLPTTSKASFPVSPHYL